MPTTKWTDEVLDPLRKAGDPLADAAIEEIYELGRQDQVREALLSLEGNAQAVPAGLPPKLEEYFIRSAALPDWADPALITRGQGLFGRYQGHFVTTLLCGSLPLCYGCADGAQVLYRSTRLTQGVYRRLMETSQFVIDVLETGSLAASARGVRSAQKIRLLHATMRYHLVRKEDWDTAWGLPVNQEDLTATLMSFSVIIPRGLAKLGVELPVQDRDALYHLWRIVGHVLGVDERVNPVSFAEGTALVEAVLHRHQRSSEAGTVLTKGVLDFIREVLPTPLFAGVGPSLIRHIIGDKAADTVSVPPADLTKLALAGQSPLSLGYGKAGDTVPLLAKASNELGLAVLKQGLRMTNKGRRYQWASPHRPHPHDLTRRCLGKPPRTAACPTRPDCGEVVPALPDGPRAIRAAGLGGPVSLLAFLYEVSCRIAPRRAVEVDVTAERRGRRPPGGGALHERPRAGAPDVCRALPRHRTDRPPTNARRGPIPLISRYDPTRRHGQSPCRSCCSARPALSAASWRQAPSPRLVSGLPSAPTPDAWAPR